MGMFRRLLIISAGWLLVFAAGMGLLLALQRDVTQGRLAGALDNILLAARNGDLAGLILLMARDLGILLLSGGVVYLAGIPARGAWIAILCGLPLFAMAAVSGFAYGVSANFSPVGFGPVGLGPTWPPRMVMFWALLIADCLLAIHYAKPGCPCATNAAQAGRRVHARSRDRRSSARTGGRGSLRCPCAVHALFAAAPFHCRCANRSGRRVPQVLGRSPPARDGGRLQQKPLRAVPSARYCLARFPAECVEATRARSFATRLIGCRTMASAVRRWRTGVRPRC